MRAWRRGRSGRRSCEWRRSCEALPEQIDEERSAGEGGHGADGNFGGGNNGAREGVGDDQRDCSAERGRGDQDAMVGAENPAHDVRDEEADVADGAADGNCESGEYRGSDVDNEADAGNVHAEVHGFFFAGEQEIEITGGGVNGGGGDGEGDAENPAEVSLECNGKVAHQPELHAVEIAADEGGHEEDDDRGEKGSRDNAGEEERVGIEKALTAAENVDGGDGGGGAEERPERGQQ